LRRSKVSEDLQTAEIMALLPEETQAEIYKKAEGSHAKVAVELRRHIDRQSRKAAAVAETEASLTQLHATERQEVRMVDALEGLGELPDASVDLIITDPPYGTLVGSAGEKNLGNAIYDNREFNDDEDEVWDLLSKAIPQFHRVLRAGCHLYLFCAVSCKHKVNFNSVAQLCQDAGFHVRPMPLIWCKQGVQGFKPPFTHWPLAYETILFASTGKRETEFTPSGDFLLHQPISGPQKRHRFEKPRLLIQSLINVSGVPDGRLLDPFCGCGPVLEAGRRTWMHVQGFDLDPAAIHESRKRLDAWDAEVLESNGEKVGSAMIRRVKAW
jgi:site-specific DNA-methyltransferase (adenine-specific)